MKNSGGIFMIYLSGEQRTMQLKEQSEISWKKIMLYQEII